MGTRRTVMSWPSGRLKATVKTASARDTTNTSPSATVPDRATVWLGMAASLL
jgi:hypothetical protein